MELYTSEEVKPMLSAGTRLFDAATFEAVKEANLLYVTIQDAQGSASHAVMELKSE